MKKLLGFNLLLAVLLNATVVYGISIDPPTRTFAKEGGGAAVIVTATPSETWTATTAASWINITPTTSGTGNGTVAYLVSANLTADTRPATVVIGGQVHTVTQTGYPSSVNPLSADFNLLGGSGQISVVVAAGISWTASSSQSWVKLISGASGFGGGTVSFTVDPQTDIATRYATISVAGKVFSISQTGTDVIVTPRTALADPETTVLTLAVRSLATTSWTVVSDVEWIFPLGASSGSGDGTVTLAVAENASWSQRSGTLHIGSTVITIAQAGKANPVYAITPTSVTAPAAGAAGAVAMSATMDAPWSVTSSVPWVTVVSGPTGVGDGGVQYVVSQNPYTTPRSGTVEFTTSPPQVAPDLMRGQLAHFPLNNGLGSYMGLNTLAGNPASFLPNARSSNPDGFVAWFGNGQTMYADFTGLAARTRPDATYSLWFRVDWDNRINRIFNMDGLWNVYTEADGRLRSDGPRGALYPQEYIRKDTWYHLIMRQTTTNVEMWLDGRMVDQKNVPDQLRSTATRISIGGGASWGGNFFQGSIDEVRVWDRALTDQEMLFLYAQETDGTSTKPYNAYVSQPTLPRSDQRVAYYRFEQSALDADRFGRPCALDTSFGGFTTDRYGIAVSAVRNGMRVGREDQYHNTSAATHSFWIKFHDLGNRTIFLKEWRNVGAREQCGIATREVYERFCLRMLDGNNMQAIRRHEQRNCTTTTPWEIRIEKPMQIERWYHFVIAADDQDGGIYIDGTLYATIPGWYWGKIINGVDANYGSAYLGVGYDVQSANADYDDYQIYDRKFTTAEVYQKYGAEKPKPLTHTITQAPSTGQLLGSETNFPASGGNGAAGLTIGSASVWSISSDSAWLTVVGSYTNGGTGAATINYSVAANNTTASRSGRLVIAGLTYTVNQGGRNVTVDGTGFSFGPDGGSSQFNVASENNASWSVINTNTWITIAAGGSGTAPATCIFVVSPYSSPLVARTGFLTAGSNVIAVTQSGYTASVSPLVNTLPANGGSKSVTVTVPPGAIWSALAQAPWITLLGSQSQSGSGTLTYIVNGNAGGARTGQIIIAGQVVTINQAAITAGALVELRPGSASTRTGSQIVIPITGYGFSNILSAQFSFKWDTTALDYVGVEQFNLPALGAANFGAPSPGTLTFSWEHPSLDYTDLTPSTPLFSVRFNVKGVPGTSSKLRIESIPTLIELMDWFGDRKVVATTQGTVSVINTFDVAGKTKYQDTEFAVTNVQYVIGGDLALTNSSGTSNSFAVSVSNNASINVSAFKSSDSTPNRGISTADTVLLRRHILGLSPITSSYKLLAADANGSGTITTADITATRRVILGQTNTLPVGMWRVIPTDYVFPIASQPWNAPNFRQYYNIAGNYTEQNFVAVKIGDIDQSWTNSSVGPAKAVLSDRNNPITIKGLATPGILIRPANGIPGGIVVVSLVASNFTGITGLQFSLDWDPQLFSYVGISNATLPFLGTGNLGTTYTAAGKLAVAWDDVNGTGVTLPDGTNIFQLLLKSTGIAGSSPIYLSDIPTTREVVVGTTAMVPFTGSATLSIRDVRPTIGNLGVVGTVFSMTFDYIPEKTYGIDYSTNLVNWTTITSPSLTFPAAGKAKWSDDGSITGGARSKKFYRVKLN